MTATEPITLSRAAEFRTKLASKIIVADGAMGTMLYAKVSSSIVVLMN